MKHSKGLGDPQLREAVDAVRLLLPWVIFCREVFLKTKALDMTKPGIAKCKAAIAKAEAVLKQAEKI